MKCQQGNSFARRCEQSNVASTAMNAVEEAKGLLVENFLPFRLFAAVFGDRLLPVGCDPVECLLCRPAILEDVGCQMCVHLLNELGVVSSAQKAGWLKQGLVGRVKVLKGEEKLRHASLKDFREAD
jgi:hypothetical protein